jgi:hypothetical protein
VSHWHKPDGARTGLRMKQAASRQLFSHWNEMRRGRASPERADLDPSAIRGCLADSFMLEVDPPLHYPFRLCGTRLAALFTRDPKGCSFLDFWNRASASEVAGLIAGVHDEAEIIVAGVSAADAGAARADYELLLLPLRHEGKTHARVMGCLVPVALPPWLGLIEGNPLTLGSWRSIGQAALRLAASASKPGAAGGFALAEAPVGPNEGSAWRRAHLVVHEGGRAEKSHP